MVCFVATTFSSINISTVEIKPVLKPDFLKSWYNKDVVVVLPFVPVTPTNFSCLDGFS